MNKLPVLLIPGTLCTPEVFDCQIKAVKTYAPQVDVVSFDLEDSISEMAETAMQGIAGTSGTAIVGFSMGGMVAMEIARRAPERVARLALVNSNSHADLSERSMARSKHLKQAREQGMVSVIRQYYLDQYLAKPNLETHELITRMAKELGVDCFASQVEALATRQDSSSTLASVDCPTLIIGSSNDKLCPPDEQIRMHKLVNDSSLELIPDCGHFSLLEKPELVNRAIENWYRRV